MRTAKTWAGPFADRFEAGFPVDRNPLRTIGREGEYPVVREDGTAADVTELWDGIEAGGGLVRQREGELTVGLAGAEYSYTIEVGRGTIEVITEPCPDLRSLQLRHEAAMARLLAVARDHGVRVLGYGVQPRTRASRALMTPKQRYQALLDVIGEPWLWFAVTASDQVQVDIARGELIGLTNVGNLLAPVVVALCANSPIQGGFDRGVQSTREARMGEIGAETGRHGMPLGPAVDAKDLVARLGGMPYLLRKEGDRLVADGQRFEDWLESVGGPEAPGAWDGFLLHEHYVWHSARPRSAHGTLELRSACQQPWGEHMAAAALSLGMVEAGTSIAAWLERELGDGAWSAMRQWHRDVVQGGLSAPPPIRGLLEGVLERCDAALRARGRGEEHYLDPLRRRVYERRNPAAKARDAFAAGGWAGLIAHAAIP